VAMTATAGLLAAAVATTNAGKKAQIADKKTAKTAVAVAGAAKASVSAVAKSTVVTGQYGTRQPVVATVGSQKILYNAPRFTADKDSAGHYPGQCVDLASRYFHDDLHVKGSWNLAKTGDAPAASAVYMMTGNPPGTTSHLNGSAVSPRVGDAIVFGPTTADPYGHVAVVVRVDGNSVTFAQQNFGWVDKATGEAHYVVTDTAPLTQASSGANSSYGVGAPSHTGYGAVLGWVHADSNNSTAPLDVKLAN